MALVGLGSALAIISDREWLVCVPEKAPAQKAPPPTAHTCTRTRLHLACRTWPNKLLAQRNHERPCGNDDDFCLNACHDGGGRGVFFFVTAPYACLSVLLCAVIRERDDILGHCLLTFLGSSRLLPAFDRGCFRGARVDFTNGRNFPHQCAHTHTRVLFCHTNYLHKH